MNQRTIANGRRWLLGRVGAQSIGALPSTAAQHSAALAAALTSCALLGLGLAGMVVIQARWAIAFLPWPLEVMYGESVIQDHAARLLRGEPLYQTIGRPSYTVVTYPPVFYVLMAAGQALVGPGLLFGRIVSVVATTATALILARIAAREGRGLAAGVLAALLYVAFGFPNPFPWLAVGKEDMLGVAFGAGSIALLAGGRGGWRTVAAAVLAALAILTKQTLIAAALAGLVGLGLNDRREALRFGVVCLGLVTAVGAGFEWSTHQFLANVVFANAWPFRMDVLLTNLATLKAYQAGPLAVSAFGVVRRLRSRAAFEDTLLPIYWAGTFVPLIGLARVGSAQNYWIELAAASAVLTGSEILFWVRRADVRSRLIGAALALAPCVNVWVAGRLALIWLPVLAWYNQPGDAAAKFAPVVEYIRSTPGEVLAEPLDALVLAQKRMLVEPFASDVLYQSGAWDIQPLVDRVCAGDVHLAVLVHPLEDDVVGYQNYAIWPAPLLQALRRTMVLQGQRGGRFIYVQRPNPSCDGSG